MDQEFLLSYENRCSQEANPACQSTCPFHLDVRSFMAHMEGGQFREAKKVLERFLPLPEILGRICDAPCEGRCLRKLKGGCIKISDLERACLEMVPERSKSLPRAVKDEKIAIVGLGLSAFTAASELTSKGYRPVCYWAGESLAENLLSVMKKRYVQGNLERLPATILEMELNLVLSKISMNQNIFTPESIELLCAEYQAVILDLTAIDLPVNLEQISSLTGTIGENYQIVYSGYSSGSIAFDMAQGKTAAVSVERLVSGTSVSAYRTAFASEPCQLYTPLEDVADLASSLPADNPSKPELQAEAARCLKCQCLDCVRHCAYLEHYKAYPKKYARQMFLNVTMVKGQHLANPLINSCALCGQCEVICPGGFSMENFTLQARREMVQNDHMPPSAHEFALEDMLDTNGVAKRLILAGKEKTKYLFFPGCQLAASRPDQVYKLYGHLKDNLSLECGFALACCGAPAHWAGRQNIFENELETFKENWLELGEPVLIVACASCWKIFSQHMPEMKIISLWEILAENAPLPTVKQKDTEDFFLHDPCSAHHNTLWHKAVRKLLKVADITYSETEIAMEKSGCCGYGGLVWNAQPDIADKICHKMASSLGEKAIVSCIMCRDRLVELGYSAWHIIDFLLPADKTSNGLEKGPGLSARRYGRQILRERLVGLNSAGGGNHMIHISESLLKELEKHFILRQDVEDVITYTEKNGQGFYDKENSRFLAIHKPRNVSFWVEYSRDISGKITVHDAYCHRMVVPMALSCGRENSSE